LRISPAPDHRARSSVVTVRLSQRQPRQLHCTVTLSVTVRTTTPTAALAVIGLEAHLATFKTR
jgi:hypothetical protein